LLGIQPGVDSALLEQAVIALLEQHDALRMKFEFTAGGGWQQQCAAQMPPGVYVRRDLRGVPETKRKAVLEQEAAQVQASLDLSAGRLVAAVEYELGEEQGRRLLLVIHHLVVDGVSWRILVEDLERGYEQLRQGGMIELGRKSSSYRQWGERLVEYSGGEEMKAEGEYWSKVEERKQWCRPLPRDYAGVGAEENTVGTQAGVVVGLEEEETRALLQEVPEVYHTQINDVLLTALGKVCGEWSGSGRVVVDLEGHGREELFAELDVSRTVGWFTSVYPVVLEVGVGERAGEGKEWEAGEALKAVKEQLRRVPKRGVGYGIWKYLGPGGEERGQGKGRSGQAAEISFNYLGQFDQVLEESKLFRAAGESSGNSRGRENRRGYVVEVTGHVGGGRLEMHWSYSAKLHRRETMEALAQRYVECLRELIAHCRSEQAGGYTPSDFPMADLSEKELTHILSLMEN
jgi:non-ribosomal peptide synthase protein (TIGR01720 family)